MMPSLTALAGEKLNSELSYHLPSRLDHPVGACLVIDADRTLGPEDTGRLVGHALGVNDTIRRIFEGCGYVDKAFIEASSVWSGLQIEEYQRELERVAANIHIRPEWLGILEVIAGQVPIFVVTAGIPQVWRLALARAGYGKIPVFGGCHRKIDDYLISARAKADVVFSLKEQGWVVVAAGDSCIDLLMLDAADIALFVPDQKGSSALRAELNTVRSVRHLIVDEQRFEGLHTCTALEVADMILCGGHWNAI